MFCCKQSYLTSLQYHFTPELEIAKMCTLVSAVLREAGKLLDKIYRFKEQNLCRQRFLFALHQQHSLEEIGQQGPSEFPSGSSNSGGVTIP